MLDVTIVGAGAIAQQGYLPAVSELPDANLRWVIDVDENRAQQVAAEFDAEGYETEYQEILEQTDAAIIATPPKFHGEIARACLQSGVHVLSEKPIASTSSEAADLVSLSDREDLHYAISRQLREAPACRLLHKFTQNGSIGTVERFHVTYGDTTSWEFASDYRVQQALAGGGVLTDKGPHVLDIALWIFGNDFEVRRYQDDSFGGLEANAWVDLEFPSTGITGTFEITGSRNIDREFVIVGDQGKIVVNPDKSNGTLYDSETEQEITLEQSVDLPNTYLLRIGRQTQRFIESVKTGERSYVPASNGVDLLRLLESCYESREQVIQPWERVGLDVDGDENRLDSIRMEGI